MIVAEFGDLGSNLTCHDRPVGAEPQPRRVHGTTAAKAVTAFHVSFEGELASDPCGGCQLQSPEHHRFGAAGEDRVDGLASLLQYVAQHLRRESLATDGTVVRRHMQSQARKSSEA